MIRKLEDKSSGLGDLRLISTFNDFIDTSEIREIARTGPKFTWTNQQEVPVQSNIDRVFMSTDWELKFPLCTFLHSQELAQITVLCCLE